jgi:hypothetical protein
MRCPPRETQTFEQHMVASELLEERRNVRTPAPQDCLEGRYTTSFCGSSRVYDVSAYRALRVGCKPPQ